MRTSVYIATFLLLTGVTARADFTAKDWRYYKELSEPPAPGFCALQLDPEVLGGARPDLADLRLITQQGTEQPYELRVAKAKQSIRPLSAKMYNLSRARGKGTRFELDLGASGELTTQITLQSPDRDFRYQVTVEGSTDSREWAVLRKGGAIFDFSGDVHACSTLVKVPETSFRYLRVTVHDSDAKPFTVNGASVERELKRPAKRIELRPVSMRIVEDSPRRATEVHLDLGHPRQFCDQAEIAFADDNVQRGCQVSVRDDSARDWSTCDAGVIFRYHTATFVGEQTRLSFPEMRGRYVHISVLNGDNTPLNIRGAKLYAMPRTLVFQWDPDQPVQLYYGANTARLPQYDLSTFLRLQQVQPRTGLSLGPQQDNPDYRLPPKPWTEQRPWLLWLVIAVAVITVGGMILRMMTKVGDLEGD